MNIWINNLYAFTKKKTGYLLTKSFSIPKKGSISFLDLRD